MPPDIRHAAWLRFAADDLKAARLMLRAELHHLACFHAQQGAEKALKAYLLARGRTVPREHHTVSLLRASVLVGLTGRNLDRACRLLDQYYLPTRYPDAVVGALAQALPSRSHATEAIRLAQSVAAAVRRGVGRVPRRTLF